VSFRSHFPLVFFVILVLCADPASREARSQFLTNPQPGDIYKEFSTVMSASSGDTWRVTDPNINLSTYPQAAPFLPNPTISLNISDLTGAVRAEAVITLWGGHISTTGKSIRFNGNAWLSLPEMGAGNGIPAGHQGYNYLQQSNLVIPVPLSHLVSGTNTFQGNNTGQVGSPDGYGFGWGQHGWYAVMIRVYFNTSKAHPTVTIISPAAGTTIGESPVITSSVSAGVTRVDYLAYYDGYDTDGDGVYQEYHHDYHIGLSESAMNIRNHVGTATASPWQVTWNTQWVPDQVSGSVKLLARVRDNTGTWYVSPEIANLTLQRTGESVKLYKPAPLGERAWARGDLDPVAVNVTIPSGDDLSRATSAAYFLRTWNGLDAAREPGETHYRRLNGWDDPTEFGENHYFSSDVRNVPTSVLKTGTNTFTYFSQTVAHHGMEILWPGPTLAVRYTTPAQAGPSITGQPVSQSVTVGATATFTVSATGSTPLTYQWQKNGVNIGGALASSYTTSATTLADNGSTYRCIVTNSFGSVPSSAATLTVTSAPPASTVSSDDFSSGTLNTSVWTFANPRGDATVGFTGAGTSDARLVFSIPAGTSHDVWAGTNYAPRILQTVTNTDFEVEAKFESVLSAGYQMQGILVQQDNATFLRFDFVRDATTTRFFAASFAAGTPTVRKDTAITAGTPLYLRVRRTGNAWTSSFSYNGTTWISATSFTQALTVSTVGPFAGNHGVPESTTPPFTGIVDFFFNTASPISPEDGGGTPTAPAIVTQPSNISVTAGQLATFTVTASGTAPLQYQWQKNGSPISGASGASYTTPATTLADNGATFRCIVSNTVNSATSNSATLTVQSAPPPSGLISDDFSGGTINSGLWTAVNPLSDATFSLTGTGTQNARLSIAIPAGVSHDLWSGVTNAPRLLQSAPNADFQVEARFESPLTSQYQFEGILVQQDASNFIRFDVVRDASSARFFTASFTGGTPTIRKDTVIVAPGQIFLRVKRQGAAWTGYFSTDGVTWVTAASFSFALTVSAIGPFAGNHGIPASSTPAFTALVDYFFNSASPISPEDGSVTPVAPAIITHPSNLVVTAGQTATFSVLASGTAPLQYQWQKNGSTIAGATGASYTTPATTLTDDGSTFRCVVSNAVNSATSNSATLSVNAAPPGPSGWWNAAWRFRFPIQVAAGAYARVNKPVEVPINFTSMLSALGQSSGLLDASIRVIEVTSTGAIIDSMMLHQFDHASGFDAVTSASGTLTFLMSGNTPAGTTRTYHVYFDTQGSFPAPPGTSLVTTTDNVTHEGQSSYRLVTQRGTYYYHKQGAGFASMEDIAGTDWINFTPGGGSAGEYRGIPNLGAVGHPGYTNASSTLLYQGPLRTVIQSQSLDNLWAFTWTIYPEFASMTLTQAGGPFWMLYEGTPGGSLDPSSDFWVRSNGQRALASATVIGDLADPEWVYFGDRSGRRFLFLAHHEDDNLEDQYWQMENNMTVFGFGRQYASTTPLMTTVPAHLTVGFGEDTLQASLVINSAFRPIAPTTGQPEANGVTPPPPPAGIVTDDFNTGTLNSAVWSVVNPLNDAAVSMTGTQLRLSVPAGVSHDVWTGVNNAPRVVQPIPNGDFSCEVKFDAAMTAQYQFQGIIALQDAGTFVRMDFVRDATSLRFFAASFSGGIATVRVDAAIASGTPLYLHVQRTGNTWAGQYSLNGITWTTGVSFTASIAATSIGVFAGNAGTTPPAFASLVDYFRNTAAAGSAAAASQVSNREQADGPLLPQTVALHQNYPNPFNPATTIRFDLPAPSHVTIRVYSMLGEEVATLADGEWQAGIHQVVFDASGRASGVYVCRMQTGDFTASRKLLLVR
jgi:hypothetical protein